MGRPLNSKYFSRGNRGKDVVSIAMDPANIGSFNSVAFPSITFNAPQLPGGVLPTAAVTDVTAVQGNVTANGTCLLYTSPSPRDRTRSRMPSSA